MLESGREEQRRLWLPARLRICNADVYPRVMLVRISLFSSSLAACQGPKTGLLNFYYVEQENRGGVRNYQGQLESKSASKNVNVARERTSIVRLTRLDLSRNELSALFVFLETNSLKFEFTYVYIRGEGGTRIEGG